MNEPAHDRFDRLRDSIVAHLEQFELRLNARLDSLEKRMDSLEKRMDSLERRMDSLEKRMDSLETRMDSLEAQMRGLRVEMTERFQSVDERFRALELRMTVFENRVEARLTLHEAEVRERLDRIAADVELLKGQAAVLEVSLAGVHARLEPLEAAVTSWAATTASLAEDVRQRFRVVNDQLAGIEQRLAA